MITWYINNSHKVSTITYFFIIYNYFQISFIGLLLDNFTSQIFTFRYLMQYLDLSLILFSLVYCNVLLCFFLQLTINFTLNDKVSSVSDGWRSGERWEGLENPETTIKQAEQRQEAGLQEGGQLLFLANSNTFQSRKVSPMLSQGQGQQSLKGRGFQSWLLQ